MTTKKNDKRQSLCAGCGRRLSVKTSAGEIKWQPSQVDDKGMFCAECFALHGQGRNKKVHKTK